MKPEIAQLAAQFLQRVTLKPEEIDAFRAVLEALGEIVKPSAANGQGDQSESPDA